MLTLYTVPVYLPIIKHNHISAEYYNSREYLYREENALVTQMRLSRIPSFIHKGVKLSAGFLQNTLLLQAMQSKCSPTMLSCCRYDVSRLNLRHCSIWHNYAVFVLRINLMQ